MNELEKRAKKHRKKQGGLSPFGYLSLDGSNCIYNDNGNEVSMSTFNKGTSLSNTAGMSESMNNNFNVGDVVEFYAPGCGWTKGTVKEIDDGCAVIKSVKGRIYNKSLQELEDDLYFEMFTEELSMEDSSLIKKIRKYLHNFNGYVKGKKCSTQQLYGMLNRLERKQAEDERKADENTRKAGMPHVVNEDPTYNFDDPDREGEYEVESIKESLFKIDRESFDSEDKSFVDLYRMYEGLENKLSAQEKNELRKLLNTTSDSETIQNYLAAVKAKDEDMDSCSGSDVLIEGDEDCGYLLDLCACDVVEELTEEEKEAEILGEDYTAADDEWGDPHDSAKIRRVIKELTNDYTRDSGDMRTSYEGEKVLAVNELKKYYDVVETSDGRRDENDDICYIISYAQPKSTCKDVEVIESLHEGSSRNFDPDNDLMFDKNMFIVRGDDRDLDIYEAWGEDEEDDAFYDADQKALHYITTGEYNVVEVVHRIETNDYTNEEVVSTHEREDYIDDDNADVSECLNEGIEVDGYTLMDIKHVPDSDGFLTDYTWWYSPEEDKHVFILGDADVYTPSTAYPDWECDNEEGAEEWWDSYEGFVDEELNEGFLDRIESIESKVLGRNGVDSLDEMSPEALKKEIRAAKSLVNQAMKRDDKNSVKTFKQWLDVLQRTANGEEFAVINDQEAKRVLSRIQGEIISHDLSEEEAIKFVGNMVRNKICDMGTAERVVNSDAFINLWNECFPPAKNESLNEYKEIDMIEKALYDVPGIQEVALSNNEAPDHYLVVFSNSGDVDEREEALNNALTAAGFDATCTAVNGSNVFEYHITKNVDESCEYCNALDEGYSYEDIKAFLDEGGGYTDHDGKVAELMDYFGMTKDEAENSIQKYVTSYCLADEASDYLGEAAELYRPEQEFTSAATSINSNKLPAIYRLVNFHDGDVVLDYGGGKFDNAVEYLKDKNVTLVVYDPFNRSDEHNQHVLDIIEEHGGADAAVNSNVLNVIKEPEVRKSVLENIQKLVKPGAPVYITVYEGRGDGVDGQTTSGYQLNRKTADYLEEVQEVFPNAKRKGKLIIANN